jgi:phenylpyruvate tautomerase PptA (4-oxalocrotonate tautomerase family)
MPYIQVNVSQTLKEHQKEQLKATLGEAITLIPGKTEAVTMVDIADGRAIYLDGKPVNGGFIDLRLYGAADRASKEALTEALFEAMDKLLGISPQHLYLNIFEMDSWGVGGKLK